MSGYLWEFEKYNGRNKLTCPRCGTARRFVRYVSTATREPFADFVGRCDRENNCGYEYTPKQYFADNPHIKNPFVSSVSNVSLVSPVPIVSFVPTVSIIPMSQMKQNETPDFIEHETANKTLTNYARNDFVKFLRSIFDAQTVNAILSVYLLGTTRDGDVIFWQVDRAFNIRTGKIIAYDSTTGSRQKQKNITFVHDKLKKRGLLKTFSLEQCFFGEHLVKSNPHIKTVAIVESEKTACVCSAFKQDVIFLASSGSNGLQDAKFEAIKDKRILLYPDADKFDVWNGRAETLRRNGFDVRTSELLERRTTAKQKKDGYDLADYFINERRGEIEFERIEREAIQAF